LGWCFVLQIKIKTLLLELFVFVSVEAEQLCRAMPPGHLSLLQGDEESEAQDLLAEVPLVHRGFEHCFVEVLKLRQRKLGRQQLEADRLVAHLALEPKQRG